jgi:wobble nucleotide-excising tRNase
MITQILSIKDFGIFKDFNWNTTSTLKDFSYKNLFYGWNYSGKTTLSRIFSSLRDKKIHESYSDSHFQVKTTKGDYNSSNLELFPYDLLIFNSDYIKDNLNFSIHKDNVSESKTILFEVGDNAKYEANIIELKNKINKITGTETIIGTRSKILKNIDEFEDYDKPNTGKLTILAKEIKDVHFISLINFTKTNLKPIISKVKDNILSNIIKDAKKLHQISKIVKTNEPKLEIEPIIYESSYSEIIKFANEIFKAVPEKKKIDKILDANPDAYAWVKKGQELHTGKNICLFCGNTIKEDRFNFLNEYYNSQASKLKLKGEKLKEILQEEENKLNVINLPLSSNDFNIGFIDEYIELRKQYDKCLKQYKTHLKKILKKLDFKINKAIHTPVDELVPFKIDEIEVIISKLNQLISNNNDFSKDFQLRIESERTLYKHHLVASFLKKEKYNTKEIKYNKAVKDLEILNNLIKEYENDILFYESKKVSDAEGALRYTNFIQTFLNRNDIEIQFESVTKKFLLIRNNENASNLSEGEKTAIAFSHFLVSIKGLESKRKFKDIIVFIDDPISSLDGNHIFQINSLLKEIFFSNDNPGGEWKLRCYQLFLSTHNFEFFNLLRELPMEKPSNESKYYIERSFIDNSADIKELPKVLDKYKSEYHFLFKEIFEFSKLRKPLKSEKLLLIPNTLRRFLEMYTLTKYPSTENVDRRADKIFTTEISKRICKPFHYFSHLNNIDRIGKQSEFIADIPVACKELIKQIKRDKLHFEALSNAVTI